MTTENQAPEGADERAAFEAQLPKPDELTWNGTGYDCKEGYENSYALNAYCAQWRGWQARAALAAPAPQAAPVALPDIDLCRLITAHEVYQYHPGALHEFAHEVIAEFCRVNGIPAPQTKEPTNDR